MADLCRLNFQFLPIKLHFFFFYGAMAGVIPFMPVLAKGLGINSTAFGLIYTVLPFCVFLSKPFFGYLTDYFQNIKAIVFILVLATITLFALILFVPPVSQAFDKNIPIDLICDSQVQLESYLSKYNQSCLEQTFMFDESCEIQYDECTSNETNQLLFQDRNAKESNYQCGFNEKIHFQEGFNCSCINNLLSQNCSIDSCLCGEETSNVYSTWQFWIFALLAVASGSGSATVYCLTDTACYEVLEDKPELYGRQRLWATISWGIITSLAGFLNDLATSSNGEANYTRGFYLMLTLGAIDLILLLKIPLTKADFSMNICRDIGKIFASYETVTFAIAVYIVGALTSLIWSYEFWFLEDLGATQTLLGLSVAVQCLVAEIPMFFFSNWFIIKLGHFNCLIGSFGALALRFFLYYLLRNPWLVLPIDITQGLTYALFYASMTAYASSSAPPGTEATMMGILGGLFEGLGVATGSLLGGVGFNKLGGHQTFLIASIISFICVPILLVIRFFQKTVIPKEERKNIKDRTHKRYDGQSSQSA